MINHGLLIALAALTVVLMMGIPIGVAILIRRDTLTEIRTLEDRMSDRAYEVTEKIDKLRESVMALLRAMEVETAEARRAVANTELALADIARNERPFGKAELAYQMALLAKGKAGK